MEPTIDTKPWPKPQRLLRPVDANYSYRNAPNQDWSFSCQTDMQSGRWANNSRSMLAALC